MSKVYAKFPKTGLGNMMLVWARAYVFAHINNLPLVTSKWWGFRWGAWVRNENKKRLYWGYFEESSFLERITTQWFRLWNPVIHEPEIKKTSEDNGEKLYLFDKVIIDNDLFGSIREHCDLIKQQIYLMLKPKLKRQLEKYDAPVISVHIRRGDFKKGNPITPQSFFIQAIKEVRRIAKEDLPVTIFTDAARNEIEEVLALPQTQLATPKADILDILLMSKSKFIILSQSSTFSYWAAFLSEAVVIRPVNDWQKLIKDENISLNYKEIKWAMENIVAQDELIAAVYKFSKKNDLTGNKVQR